MIFKMHRSVFQKVFEMLGYVLASSYQRRGLRGSSGAIKLFVDLQHAALTGDGGEDMFHLAWDSESYAMIVVLLQKV